MPTILVVDDDRIVVRLVQDILAPMKFNIVVACTGQEALDLLAELTPDLILMDLYLPTTSYDGWETTRRIRLQRHLSNIPIIALTAADSHEARQEAQEAGCNGYIAKPFTIQQLLSHLKHYLPA